MVAFYRALGFDIAEQSHVVSVYVGEQMINFHRPATWTACRLDAAGAERRGRRAATSASSGTGRRMPSAPASTVPARRSKRGRWRVRVAADGARRACTCAIPTATSSNS